MVAPSLTVNEVSSVPLIAKYLFGYIFKVPVPEIVKEAPFCSKLFFYFQLLLMVLMFQCFLS